MLFLITLTLDSYYSYYATVYSGSRFGSQFGSQFGSHFGAHIRTPPTDAKHPAQWRSDLVISTHYPIKKIRAACVVGFYKLSPVCIVRFPPPDML